MKFGIVLLFDKSSAWYVFRCYHYLYLVLKYLEIKLILMYDKKDYVRQKGKYHRRGDGGSSTLLI